MHEETVYEALNDAGGGEGHWAFGTGFDEPLAGVDTTVPEGIDPADLGAYCLMLGDDALVLAQRLTEWITAAPELEEEVAIGNIALDLLGQARLLLARAGSVGVMGRSRERATASIPDEDALAYFRDPDEFRHTPRGGAQRGLRADDDPPARRLDRAAGGRHPPARVP
ncbi:Phenylacetic acid catabolic protein [Blastococcus brunescens]|uniref:Phenylacetic acid catabolic protein n=1 Tax=Blastococcus brunescens TaxID=1564165 RepID=A0ABZ1B8T8_9ACTN|nr:Phenylacetic acid catabolic protein [Blastococcus sp. BMG 8361]WRL65470.1 Phenylacetic acid catabolic protein [Blastococcus sp. BMG 8361]